MKKRLTQKFIDSIKPNGKRQEYYDKELTNLRLRVGPTGHKAYYAMYRNAEGRKVRYSLGTTDELTPKQARTAARNCFAKVQLGEDPAKAKKQAKAYNLGAFLEDVYGPRLKERCKTGDAMLKRLLSTFKPLLGKRLVELTPWVLEQWRRTKRRKSKCKARTVNRDLAYLKTALNWAVANGILEFNPLANFKRLPERDSEDKERYLSEEEERRLFRALYAREEKIRLRRDTGNAWRRERGRKEKPDLRKARFADHLLPMVIVSLNTGLRRGELFSLKWEDIDFEKRLLTVRAASAKSGKVRHIPLTAGPLQALKDWQAQTSAEGLVFKNADGKRFDNVNTSWERVLEAAKIENFRWHDMRHDFASKLVMSGEKLQAVQKLLGHSSIVMTERYAHLAPDDMRNAILALEERGLKALQEPGESNIVEIEQNKSA